MKSIFRILVLVLVCLVLAAFSTAQQSSATGQKVTVIRAAHMLDVKSGRLIDNPVVVITDDKITSVNGPAPSGAAIINLAGATLLPGLIDAHTHIVGKGTNFGYQELGESIPAATLWGARNARVTLEAGFTTIRNVGASGYADVALRDAINDGLVPGPRMLVGGPPLGITGGRCDDNLLPFA